MTAGADGNGHGGAWRSVDVQIGPAPGGLPRVDEDVALRARRCRPCLPGGAG